MSNNKDKPAFPTTQYANGVSPSGHDNGMTLRDYFAAKAMPVHMAALSNWAAGSPEAWQNEIARLSYATADAMLRAREVA